MEDEAQPTLAVKPSGDGPVEPRSIIFVGGPLNGKKHADLGQTEWVGPEADLYRRVRMDAGDRLGRLAFDVLAYFGKSWGGCA